MNLTYTELEKEIYQSAYETIRDSLEWSYECKDNEHSLYVEGVILCTKQMIENLDRKLNENNNRPMEEYDKENVNP